MKRSSKRFDLVLVAAGNYSQAHCWAREKGLAPTQWVYAHSVESFVGIHFDKYAKVGTYAENFRKIRPWFYAVLEPNAKDVTNCEIHFTDL
jgi:hypothetical protein